ncbi:hypothetical protein FRC01_000100 [Tulasnella sp. 417]|nr:hypothetical protein FRC01_000100 [Tulasnella sp. 417]
MANVFLPHQSQPQSNREYIFDDPLAPLRLAPLAQISEFWRRYDRLADIHDKKLTANLNGNLDVLLIFAALFSAINTTFISITMPDLSPNPSDETNALLRLLVMRADNNTLTPSDLAPPFSANPNSITVNCLLYASLSCSLLAAVGAMMAKEWLQSFDRTGQTGPLEEQARFRQRKFNGVQEWHLEAVIKFLPNLLLLSVILFFAGICLFLFPINTIVAGIVIAFSGIGAIFSGIVIVAGAASLACPYQSAASNALRRGSRGLAQPGRVVWRVVIRPAFRRTSEELRKVRTNMRPWTDFLRAKASSVVVTVRSWYRRSLGSDQSAGQDIMEQAPARLIHVVSYVYSAIRGYFSTWLPVNPESEQAENQDSSNEPESRLSVGGVSEAIAREGNSDEVLTIQAARWLLETTSNRGDQISTAQFVCSIDRTTCVLVFEDYDSWKRLLKLTLDAFAIWYSQPNKDNQEVAELFGLMLCWVLLRRPKEDDRWKDITEQALHEGSNKFENAFLRNLRLVSDKYSSDTPEDDHCILHISVIYTALQHDIDVKQYQWVKPCCFLDDPGPIAAALLRLWVSLLVKIGTLVDDTEYMFLRLSLVELLDGKMSLALGRISERIISIQGDINSERNAVGGYIVCLQRARELCQNDDEQDPKILSGLGELIWSYIDSLTTSGSTDILLVRFLVEVLLTFKAFLPSQPSSSATPSPPSYGLIPFPELIETVVDVLLDDLTSLTSQDEKWKSRGRTFKACVIRILLCIWRNHPYRDFGYWDRSQIFVSWCQLWAPLEDQVNFAKNGSFNSEEKPLTPDDLKGVLELAEWALSKILWEIRDFDENSAPIHIETSAFIVRCADMGINRLYAHFDRYAEWKYHLYDPHQAHMPCSRSVYRDDTML